MPLPTVLAPPSADPGDAPLVRTCGDHRTLEFSPGHVQSDMLLSDPSALVLAYCRAIMCFALFVPRPRHIVMVGLGGGSLAKFCHRHFAHSRISVLELRADVIALRESFAIPADDARFQVIHADARHWLAEHPDCADVLVLDGFDAAGLPATLGSARFYSDCRRALCDGGVMVANIFSYDPHYPGMLARLRLQFEQRVCWLDKVAGNNRILFAIKGPAGAAQDGRAVRVQRWMARRNGLGAGLLNRLLVKAVIAWLKRQ